MLNFTVSVFCVIINWQSVIIDWQMPANRPRKEIARNYKDNKLKNLEQDLGGS